MPARSELGIGQPPVDTNTTHIPPTRQVDPERRLVHLTQEVRHHFEEEETRRGYTNAAAVAQSIAPGLPIARDIEHAVTRMPTSEYLYPGAVETVKGLISTGDHVTVWTQGDPKGQMWKVGLSGIGSVRKSLPVQDRRRFSVVSSMDKVADLADVVQRKVAGGLTNIVVVDDKAKNIVKADEAIKEAIDEGTLPPETQFTAVWINQGRTKDQVPEGYTPDTFKERFLTIEDIRELDQVREAVRAGRDDQVAWLIDFDHTLLHTAGAKEGLFGKVAGMIADRMPDVNVSPRVDHELGLNGNVRAVRELLTGMSGGQVLHIETDDQSFVVKHNPNAPERVRREIRGYELLQGTPLERHLLPPTKMSGELALLAMPYQEGIQLRQGVKNQEIDTIHAGAILSDLLDTELHWWQKQDKSRGNDPIESMQRSEWNDTVDKVEESMATLSEHFGIPLDKLWTLPISHGGQEYGPFLNAMRQVHILLADHPPYTVLDHNDASGANILVNPQDGSWKLVDAEWAGYADPAESFVRMIKYASTTTLSDLGPIRIQEIDGRLEIDVDPTFPDAALRLQEIGLSRVRQFGTALRDPDFENRVKEYLAGSYIREIALAAKRGNPDLAVFGLLKAVESLQE